MSLGKGIDCDSSQLHNNAIIGEWAIGVGKM